MQIVEQLYQSDYESKLQDTKESTRMTWMYRNFSYFLIYSFIGWIWETVITSIDTGTLQKRGFLDLPILPIYGFAITIIVLLFYQREYSIPKIFIGSAAVTSICEFITSWTLERIFHQVWWDYSHMKFQIQGRICLIGALIFGFASVVIVRVVQPRIVQLVNHFLQWEKSRAVLNLSALLIVVDLISKSIRLLR